MAPSVFGCSKEEYNKWWVIHVLVCIFSSSVSKHPRGESRPRRDGGQTAPRAARHGPAVRIPDPFCLHTEAIHFPDAFQPPNMTNGDPHGQL